MFPTSLKRKAIGTSKKGNLAGRSEATTQTWLWGVAIRVVGTRRCPEYQETSTHHHMKGGATWIMEDCARAQRRNWKTKMRWGHIGRCHRVWANIMMGRRERDQGPRNDRFDSAGMGNGQCANVPDQTVAKV